MRILKVSFKNLNSLAGQWSIDFRDPVFELNGLFLITGPTGSGKTTLLDAISLALYGQTPRVNVSAAQNEIMTRHTNECWAEVLFETGSGVFLARWEQKRQANGKLAPPKRQLARADGEILAEKIKEVEQEIAAQTGLDFSQFTRAIMLAQGAFSAFLTAKDDEKSAILEKVTDTSIYSDLSILAHNMEKDAKEAKTALENELRPLALLNEAEVKGKTEQIAQYDADIAASADAIAACQKNIKWLETVAKLQLEQEALAQANQALNERIEAFAPKQAQLTAGKKAVEFEASFAAISGQRKQLDEARQRLARIEKEQQQLASLTVSSTARAGAAKKELDLLKAEFEAAQKPLAEARRLDRQIQEEINEQKQLMEVLAAQNTALQKGSAKLEQLKNDDSELEEQLKQIGKWLEEHPGGEWLLENWGELKEKIRLQEEQWQLIGKMERQATESGKGAENLAKQISDETGEYENAQSRLKENQAALADLEQTRKEALGGWTLEGLRAALKDKRLAQTAAEVIKSLEEHRKQLSDGKPCPLCGALEHPFATGNIPDASVVEIQCREIEHQIDEVEACQKRIDAKTKEKDNASNQATLLEERLKNLRDKHDLLVRQHQDTIRAAADLKNKAIANDNAVESALAPLGFRPPLDRPEIIRTLDLLLADWREHTASQKKLGEKRAQLAVSIATTNADNENMARSALEKNAEAEKMAALIAGLRNERKAILGGKDADQEEARLKKVCNEAQEKADQTKAEMDQAEDALNRTNGAAISVGNQIHDLEPELAKMCEAFKVSLAQVGWEEESFLEARQPASAIKQLEEEERELERTRTGLETKTRDKRKELEEELALNLTEQDIPALQREAGAIAEAQRTMHEARAALIQELRQNEERQNKTKEIRIELEQKQKDWQKWSQLDALIGSADGKKFRAFAQNITLDLLLEHANQQLGRITDRYTVQRRETSGSGREKFLELAVVDNYQGGELRTIDNLSGGETFLISLALALGLSAMSGSQSGLGSLFLDEGFGTLDRETLETAISAISSLRSEGKLIGIISHVEALQDRIPVQIKVKPKDLGRSEIDGPGCKPGA